jgi:hypothetical protein
MRYKGLLLLSNQIFIFRLAGMMQEDGYVKVADLGRIFKVSEVAIRHDLVDLDNICCFLNTMFINYTYKY